MFAQTTAQVKNVWHTHPIFAHPLYFVANDPNPELNISEHFNKGIWKSCLKYTWPEWFICSIHCSAALTFYKVSALLFRQTFGTLPWAPLLHVSKVKPHSINF